ncbi:MAG TPA: polysaccharide deacetylase family protein [Terriglobales bacterium]|nr:polysaccharide deacetylase family protein [Terriglobales bacterium]
MRTLAQSDQRFVTISVDDGHPTDLRTRDLLQKYGLKATFYVPARNAERPVMSATEFRELGRSFELGSHTFNHVALGALPLARVREEIIQGQQWLQDLLGTSVTSFCYPRGKFTPAVSGLVEEAGFLGARTCMFNLTVFPKNPFLWGVSTHASDHTSLVQIRHALLEQNFAGAFNYWRVFKGCRQWDAHFSHSMDWVAKHGGIAHLYLHSWEIDRFDQWHRLEAVFRSIAANRALNNVTNGTLFKLWRSQRLPVGLRADAEGEVQ